MNFSARFFLCVNSALFLAMKFSSRIIQSNEFSQMNDIRDGIEEEVITMLGEKDIQAFSLGHYNSVHKVL